jgi:MFS family permease
MAILSSFEFSEREKYIGWVEAATGVGLLFGPLLGGMLFTVGGYLAPFITFGKYCIIHFIY